MYIYPDDIKKYSGTLIKKDTKIEFKIKKKIKYIVFEVLNIKITIIQRKKL